MQHKYIQTKFRKFGSDTTLIKHTSNIKQINDLDESIKEPNVIIVDFPPNLQSLQKKTTINDFIILSLLGRGAYAKVVKAQLITSDGEYAIKIIDKRFLEKIGKQYEVHAEKTALVELNHPNIVKLYSTFQDSNKIYFVLEYCSNRDLAQLISNYGTLPIALIKYYTAEIVSALEHMHSKGIYHRDLKLENITISEKMHLKIIDFATMNKENKLFDKKTMKFIDYDDSVIIEKLEEGKGSSSSSLSSSSSVSDNDEDDNQPNLRIIDLNKTFVGTADYVSPEVLNKTIKDIGPSCDLWALGVIIYTLFNGKTPFQGKTQKMTFQNILNCNYTYNDGIAIPDEAKDLISKLLIIDHSKRLGRGEKGFEEIKKHPFLAAIDFKTLNTTDPPIDPRIFLAYRKYEGLSASPIKKRCCNNDQVNTYIRPSKKANINTSKFLNSSFGTVVNNMNQMDSNMKIKQKTLLQDTLLVQLPHYSISILCRVKLFSDGRIIINELSFEQKRTTISIDEFSKIQGTDEYNFNISTSKDLLHFKHPTLKVAKTWTEKVSEIISQKISINSKGGEDCNVIQLQNS